MYEIRRRIVRPINIFLIPQTNNRNETRKRKGFDFEEITNQKISLKISLNIGLSN